MNEKTKVLVVDDDVRMTRTICDILIIKGYGAIDANSGEEALEKLQSCVPDCILMDIKMEGIDGIETLKIIREKVPEVPIILMSGYVTEEQISEAKLHGAYVVLNKPVDIKTILTFLSILKKEKNILILDDDADFCKTLKDILQLRNYSVETEINPEKILSYLEREYKLVILLDLKLGEFNGSDILKTIRLKYPTKPVIIFTGYKEEMADSITKGLQTGAYACLYKPFNIEELVQYIEDINVKKFQFLLGERIDL
jgi:two-component system, NtrC family, response regulator HydG